MKSKQLIRYTLFWMATCIVHFGAVAEALPVTTVEFDAPSVGRTNMKYNIILPAGYEGSDKRYPVLYLLHGGDGDYGNWAYMRVPEYAARYEMIVVMPDAGNSCYVNWAQSEDGQKNAWEDYMINDVIGHVDANYRTIARREGRAINGLSVGGYGALMLGLRHPDMFCSIGSHSGTIRLAAEVRWSIEHGEDWMKKKGQAPQKKNSKPLEKKKEEYDDEVVAKKLKELTRTPQPWSLVASFWGPHQPYFPTEPYASMVDPKRIPQYPTFNDDLKGRPFRYILHRDFDHRSRYAWPEWSTWQHVLARAYGQGYQTDAAIGQILNALEQSGQAKNTLVIWCADHGDALASHGGLWDKAATYIEEVARVPMAIRWPTRFKGAKRTDKIISNMDITATILQAAGIKPPGYMHSRSLLDLCRAGEGVDWPEYTVAEHHGHSDEITQRIIVGKKYKYVAALFDGDELYDLQNDPFERHNLVNSKKHRDIADQLRGRIIKHIEKNDDWRAKKLTHAHKLAHALKLGR